MINKEKEEKEEKKKDKPTDTMAVRVSESLQIVDKESGEKIIDKRG